MKHVDCSVALYGDFLVKNYRGWTEMNFSLQVKYDCQGADFQQTHILQRPLYHT